MVGHQPEQVRRPLRVEPSPRRARHVHHGPGRVQEQFGDVLSVVVHVDPHPRAEPALLVVLALPRAPLDLGLAGARLGLRHEAGAEAPVRPARHRGRDVRHLVRPVDLLVHDVEDARLEFVQAQAPLLVGPHADDLLDQGLADQQHLRGLDGRGRPGVHGLPVHRAGRLQQRPAERVAVLAKVEVRADLVVRLLHGRPLFPALQAAKDVPAKFVLAGRAVPADDPRVGDLALRLGADQERDARVPAALRVEFQERGDDEAAPLEEDGVRERGLRLLHVDVEHRGVRPPPLEERREGTCFARRQTSIPTLRRTVWK